MDVNFIWRRCSLNSGPLYRPTQACKDRVWLMTVARKHSIGIRASGESVPIGNLTSLVSILGISMSLKYGYFLTSVVTAGDLVELGSLFTDHTSRSIILSLLFTC